MKYLHTMVRVSDLDASLRFFRDGLGLVQRRPERVMALAVDQRNTPAVALYARLGFRTVRRREAFVAQPPPYSAPATSVK